MNIEAARDIVELHFGAQDVLRKAARDGCCKLAWQYREYIVGCDEDEPQERDRAALRVVETRKERAAGGKLRHVA